jgi:hypothetical protein
MILACHENPGSLHEIITDGGKAMARALLEIAERKDVHKSR